MVDLKDISALATASHPPHLTHALSTPSSGNSSPSSTFSFPQTTATGLQFTSSPPSPYLRPEHTHTASSSLDNPAAATDSSTKLDDMDHQVKLALTELLNSASVKADPEMRMWVQNRLMETEHRIKARRRHRLSNAGQEKRDSFSG